MTRFRVLLKRVAFGMALAATAFLTPSQSAEGQMKSPSSDPQNISGVWWINTFSAQLRPMDGKEIPLTEEGKKRFETYQQAFKNRNFDNMYAKAGVVATLTEYFTALRAGTHANMRTNMADLRQNSDPTDPAAILYDTTRKCLPPGIPRAMASPYPFRILQIPKQVTFQYEMNRIFRIVRMNVKHANPEYWDPSFMGESVAHWESDTLVIDTTNFNGRTTLDRAGLPSSEQLHVVERLKKINRGRQLEAVITIEDPAMYTRPWKTRIVYDWRPDVKSYTDSVCDEPQRDVSMVKGVVK